MRSWTLESATGTKRLDRRAERHHRTERDSGIRSRWRSRRHSHRRSGGGSPGKGRTLRADALRRLRKNKLAVAGLIWIIIVILIAITADLWVPYWLGDPTEIDTTTVAEESLQPPSVDHPFGTDKLGRDIASRVVYGARVSLLVGVVAVFIMVAIGLVLGAIAAYYGGIWDSFIMRTADVFFAFPYILFAITLIAVLGQGLPERLHRHRDTRAGRVSPGSSAARSWASRRTSTSTLPGPWELRPLASSPDT